MSQAKPIRLKTRLIPGTKAGRVYGPQEHVLWQARAIATIAPHDGGAKWVALPCLGFGDMTHGFESKRDALAYVREGVADFIARTGAA